MISCEVYEESTEWR